MLGDNLSELEDFSGTARLFPLPGLVLYPSILQALHVFEPRYRQLTVDALAGDRLMALVLLRPDWEAGYQGRPAIHSVACLGKIFAEQRLPDGRFNLQLRGLRRVRIIHELEHDKLYRSAQVELLADRDFPAAETDRALRRRLQELLPAWCEKQATALEMLTKLLKSELPLGTLSDIIAYALPLAVELKQETLERLEVEQRARALIQHLENHRPSEDGPVPERKFPPGFSEN